MTPEETGLDFDRAASLPECHACRKKSDGAKIIEGTVLCGAHYDEWMIRRYKRGSAKISAAEFARELRTGRFWRCWEAMDGD